MGAQSAEAQPLLKQLANTFRQRVETNAWISPVLVLQSIAGDLASIVDHLGSQKI